MFLHKLNMLLIWLFFRLTSNPLKSPSDRRESVTKKCWHLQARLECIVPCINSKLHTVAYPSNIFPPYLIILETDKTKLPLLLYNLITSNTSPLVSLKPLVLPCYITIESTLNTTQLPIQCSWSYSGIRVYQCCRVACSLLQIKHRNFGIR